MIHYRRPGHCHINSGRDKRAHLGWIFLRNLRVTGTPERESLTVVGQSIIKSQMFDYLEEYIANKLRERGEFKLASVLDCLRQDDGFRELIVDGQCYDIGSPAHYLEMPRTFSLDGSPTARSAGSSLSPSRPSCPTYPRSAAS